MKRKWPWIVVAVMILWLIVGLKPSKERTDFHTRAFGRLPVLMGGRIQPIDSLARNTLLMIHGSQSLPLLLDEGGDPDKLDQKVARMTATEWLLETAMRPEIADKRFLFRIHHPEVIRDLELTDKGIHKSGLYWFSYNTLTASPNATHVLVHEADRIKDIDEKDRTTGERQIAALARSYTLYRRLKNSFRPENANDFLQQIEAYEAMMPAGVQAMQQKQAGQAYDEQQFQTFMNYLNQFDTLSTQAMPLLIPPENPNLSKDEWQTIGAALFSSLQTGIVPQAVKEYAAMTEAYRRQQPDRFNQIVDAYANKLAGMFPQAHKKGAMEFFFNQYDPFYKSTCLYVLALILGCVYWLNLSEGFRRAALYLTVLSLVIHSSGLIFRMTLEGRPPVTNLYSSAIFIGWGAVLLGVILERWYKNSIGVVMACMIGFITLRIAKALSLDGDTMEMLQAVLDTNAWLATHVVIITLGYAATFVGGFLGLLYILLGAFTPALTRDTGKSIVRMVYGTVCFATLLSFVGTILGGIWADQSWGRFWGWDPKENGALLIVLWNALILHARWGGMIRDRGLMVMAVFGNIVTSFSWFGVNLLEVGLHSYGFMSGSFWWLIAFAVSQLIIMGVGCFFPQKYWRLNAAPRSSP